MKLLLEINQLINKLHQANSKRPYFYHETVLANLRYEAARLSKFHSSLIPYQFLAIEKQIRLIMPDAGDPNYTEINQKLIELTDYCKSQMIFRKENVTA